MELEKLGQAETHPMEDTAGQAEMHPDMTQAEKESAMLAKFLTPKVKEAMQNTPMQEESVIKTEEVAEETPEQYTPEEMRETGIDKLDPKRIPAELMPYYKSMLADYRQKTMKLAEERKQAVESKPKEPEEAPEVRAKKRADALKNKFKSEYGVDYELWNEDHQVLMTALASQETVAQDKQQALYQSMVKKWDGLNATVSAEPQLLPYAQAKISSLLTSDETADKGLALSTALYKAKTNPGLLTPDELDELVTFTNTVKKEYYAEKTKPKETKPPTQLESVSTPAPKTTKPLTVKDIQGASPEEQARLLFEASRRAGF